jgi:hypothetical protein
MRKHTFLGAAVLPLLFIVASSCLLCGAALAQQKNATFDPLKQFTSEFPGSVKLKNNGRLLELCPDNTCDGFVVSGTLSVSTLKDFAYLYEFFFSDFVYMDEWRTKPEAKDTAQKVLSKTEYRNCASNNGHEAARCVLLNLSRDGRIKLIFVRYDEGTRGVVPMDIKKELAEKPAATTPR